MVNEFDGEIWATGTRFLHEEYGEVPLVVITGKDEVEPVVDNDTVNTWNVSAPEDRTRIVTDHLEVETGLGALTTNSFTEGKEGLGADNPVTETEVVIASEDSGELPEQTLPLQFVSQDLLAERDTSPEKVMGSTHEMVSNVAEELPEKEAQETRESPVEVDTPDAESSDHSAATQEGVDDIPPTKPPHTTGVTDSGDEEGPEKKTDHQQPLELLAESNRESKDIATLDTIIDYEAAARQQSKRHTSNPVWVESCVSTLNQPEGTNTSRVAYSIGQDHDTMRTALSGMVALGLASETGRVTPDRFEGHAGGRPTREFTPEPALERFVHDYNDLRLKILSENLPEQLQGRTPAQLEQQALATYASAHQETLGQERSLTPDVIAARLGVNREAVRYYAFNSFAAAYPGATQIVSYELGREIKDRRQQRAEVELPIVGEADL